MHSPGLTRCRISCSTTAAQDCCSHPAPAARGVLGDVECLPTASTALRTTNSPITQAMVRGVPLEKTARRREATTPLPY